MMDGTEIKPTAPIDLHVHTSASDGKHTPRDVVYQAHTFGLKSIAITDHDNLSGIEEAIKEGSSLNIEVIPGIELSVQYKNYKDLHILSYYPRWKGSKLANILLEFQQSRRERGEKIVGRINQCLEKEQKKTLDYHNILTEAKGSLGRMHLARKLVEYGHVRDINEAFTKYLNPLNVPKKKFTAQEAIATISEEGGISVLAHPKLITPDPEVLEEIVREFATYGLDGLEGIYPGQTYAEFKFYRYLCQKYQLILTGGSDYHGDDAHGMLGRIEDYGQLNYQLVISLRKRFFDQKNFLVGFQGFSSPKIDSLVQTMVDTYEFQYICLDQLRLGPSPLPWEEQLDRLIPDLQNKKIILFGDLTRYEERMGSGFWQSLGERGIKTFIICSQDRERSDLSHLTYIPLDRPSAHYLMHLIALAY